MRYKYFFKTDKKKETVGTVEASSLDMALNLAAQAKKLSVSVFVKLFKVEKFKHEK